MSDIGGAPHTELLAPCCFVVVLRHARLRLLVVCTIFRRKAYQMQPLHKPQEFRTRAEIQSSTMVSIDDIMGMLARIGETLREAEVKLFQSDLSLEI